MNPRIEMLSEKKLIGKRITLSMSANKTYELWHSFMPHRKEIQHTLGADLYSVQVYNPDYFSHFNPDTEFEKWAAIEVSGFESIPEGMESFILPAGLYAVFLHKGPASAGAATFGYIFSTWLPNSEYSADDRPHFEILGAKYKNDDPESEEEIWIPVKKK